MSAREMASLIEREGVLRVESGALHIPVRVIDARVSWGATHVQIVPIGGGGSKWVDLDRVSLEVRT